MSAREEMTTKAIPVDGCPPSYTGLFRLNGEGKLPEVAEQAQIRAEMLGFIAELGGEPYGPRACQPLQRVP